MGAVLDFGKKAVDKAKAAGQWCVDHSWELLDYAGCGLAGYGLGALICDVTGLTDWAYKQEYQRGRIAGYDQGFNDGMDSAARVIGTANNGGVKPNITQK